MGRCVEGVKICADMDVVKKLDNTPERVLGLGEVNLFRLNQNQRMLYCYLVACFETGKPVEFEDVAKIYYHNKAAYGWCKGERVVIDGKTGYEYFVETRKKYADEYAKSGRRNSTSWLELDVRNWLKSNIGSFVMRGLLVAVPKFNIKDE